MKTELLIVFRTSAPKISKMRLTRLCEGLVKSFARHSVVKKAQPRSSGDPLLTLVFVGRAESRQLNKKYRRKNYPTDVLSFLPGEKGLGLGELVICAPILRLQAKGQGYSFEKELDYMVIHGFLHLLGYDHEKSRREELKMNKLQDMLFCKLSKYK